MRRLTLALAVAAAAVGFSCGTAYADGTVWWWLLGSDLNSGTIGQVAGATNVYVGNYYGGSSSTDFEGASFVREATDSYFEFEHGGGESSSMLLPETSEGAPTPMTIGKADGQNVTPLIVSGTPGITGDLQSWQLGAASQTGIDAQGLFRVNGIVLKPTMNHGEMTLQALLPDGSEQRLVPVGP